jgi:hypothetical protein
MHRCAKTGASATKQKERAMTMTRLLLCTATILALTASYAGAPEPLTKKGLNDKKEANEDWMKHGIRIQEFTRYVISGKSIILYFEHALNEDCSPGEFDVRVYMTGLPIFQKTINVPSAMERK